MNKNSDFNNVYGYGMYPPYYPYENVDPSSDNMFNPLFQYEQGYMYYRYLTQQLDYKIKCKEFEKLSPRNDRRVD